MELPDWALPAHHRIGPIELQGAVHVGSAGVLYRGWDHAAAVSVAVEEYLPHGLSRRLGNGHVDALDDACRGAFELGRQAFSDKARTLARCEHAALLRVLQLMQANGTAYSVMPWYMGRPMEDVVGPEHPLPEVDLRSLLADLLGALHAYHRHGGLHGDLRPAKVLLLDDGHGLLLGPDGAAGTKAALLPADPARPAAPAPVGPQADLQAMALLAQWCMGCPSPTERFGIGAAARRARRSMDAHYSAAFRRWLDGPFSSDANARPHSAAQFRHWLLQLPEVAGDDQVAAPAAAVAHATGHTANAVQASVLAPATALAEAAMPQLKAPAMPALRAGGSVQAAPEGLALAVALPRLDALDRTPQPARSSLRALHAAMAAAILAAAAVAAWTWWGHHRGDPAPQRTTAAARTPPPVSATSLLSAGATPAPVTPPAPTAVVALTALAPVVDAAASAAESADQVATVSTPAPAGEAAPVASEQTAAPATPERPQAPARLLADGTRNVPDSPRAQCGERTEFSLYRCMQQQCAKPRWQSHADCVRFRRTDTVS